LSSSRIRLYLDLKLSPLELSRWRKLPYGQFGRYKLDPAKYLKEMTSKWSIFEKPYLDDDSPRSMNLHFNPNWPAIPKFDGVGPPGGGLWIFRWDEGMCWISAVGSYECGKDDTLRMSVGLVPPGHEISYSYSAHVVQGDVIITSIEPHKGLSATINIRANDDFDGAAAICGKVGIGGQVLQEVVVESPFSGGKLAWEKALALPPQFQVSTTYREGYQLDCGCQDFDVECDTCDDSGLNWIADDPVLVNRNQSTLVTIEDSLGKGGPYSWEVTGGTGLSMANAVTIGTSNYLVASDSACGSGYITVTGCDGNVIQGNAKCSTGEYVLNWTMDSIGCSDSCGNCCKPGTCWGTHTSAISHRYPDGINRVTYPSQLDMCGCSTYCMNDPINCPDATCCDGLEGEYTFTNSNNLVLTEPDIFKLLSGYSASYGCWNRDIKGYYWGCA